MTRKVISFFAERSLLINIISIFVVAAGLVFLFTTNKEAFPKIDYDWVIINTVYPGATAEDIEKHVSIPIEDQMREIDGIKDFSTTSVESMSVTAIQLDPDLENKDKTVNDIKNALDRITDFPEDAEDPVVTELTTARIPVLEISVMRKDGVRTDGEERELRTYAKRLEDRIYELSGVARVDRRGYRDREMIVEVFPKLLDRYHVAMNDIILALSKKNLNFPGGLVRTNREDVMIRTIGEVENATDIRNVLIRANDLGNWVRISDVANVKDSFEEETVTNKIFGHTAVTLTVLKKESADIIDLVYDVQKEIDLFKKNNKSYNIETSNDMSYFVKRRLKVLVNNGIFGLALVVASLFITLGWRIALVTAMGIPIAFCGTFIWMGQVDITINLMSMFGLIMVLGMLVDDAIVVAENIYRHMEEGWSVKDAVINGATEVVIPVAGTIMTTIAAFSPLMYMSGIMGKFMWTLPAVVSVALVASWVESMFILPAHIYDIEKFRKVKVSSKHKQRDTVFGKIKERYATVLTLVLTHKYKAALVITLVFIGSLVFAKHNLKLVIFPQGKIERLVVKAEAPTGTSLKAMSNKIAKIEKNISELPKDELDNYITRTGEIREQPMDPNSKTGTNYATIIINLTAEEKRERKALEIIRELRTKGKKFENLFEKVEYTTVRNGPPVGKAVNITVKGEDFPTLEKVSDEVKTFLGTIKGVKDIKDDFEEGKKELRIFVDEKTASIAGLTVMDIASTVRSCFEGTVATTIKKAEEEIDIRVIFPPKIRNNIKSLNDIKISNLQGNLVPLNRVARFKPDRGISVIQRNDWKRSITVTADIDEKVEKVSSNYVNSLIQKEFKDIDKKYPTIILDFLGEFRDTQESMEGLIRSFAIAIFVIYVILVALFRSLIHPLIIMGVIPLTAIGVIWTFYFHGRPFSFLALMGIVGLAGVVVNDSIVLVDFIKNARSTGLSTFNATIHAGKNRIRAVFLTTITTFFGILPTAYGWGGNDPFLKPMAIALSWGLLFGTFITLIGTPILYNIFSDLRKLIFRKERSGESFQVQHFEEAREDMESRIKSEIESSFRESIKQEIQEEMERKVKPEKKKVAGKKKAATKKKK